MPSNANWFLAARLSNVEWFDARVGPAPPGFRRFVPEDLHLTLAFLGPCGEPAARAAWAACAARRRGAIAATLSRVEPMGDPRRFSALSATLDRGRDVASALIADLRHPACDAAGAPREARTPRPHVTVARANRDCTDAQRDQALPWAAAIDIASVEITLAELALITWATDRGARLFREVLREAL